MSHIMIVDDDVMFAENLKTLLSMKGHMVSIVDQIDGALEELQRNKPDLLILDIMFPAHPSAGFDLAREIRRDGEVRDIPIIMLTALNHEFPMEFSEGDIDPEWMPVQSFMDKPVDVEELVRKVEELA